MREHGKSMLAWDSQYLCAPLIENYDCYEMIIFVVTTLHGLQECMSFQWRDAATSSYDKE